VATKLGKGWGWSKTGGLGLKPPLNVGSCTFANRRILVDNSQETAELDDVDAQEKQTMDVEPQQVCSNRGSN